MEKLTYKQLYRLRPGIKEKLKLDAKQYNSKPEVKLAHANQRLLKRYGITLEEKEILVNKRNWKCEICGSKFLSLSKAHIDHNHETGQIRGILCSRCNTKIVHVIEYFPDLLDLAKGYLDYYERKGVTK